MTRLNKASRNCIARKPHGENQLNNRNVRMNHFKSFSFLDEGEGFSLGGACLVLRAR